MPSFRIELHSHCQGDPVDTRLHHNLFQHIDRAKEVGLDEVFCIDRTAGPLAAEILKHGGDHALDRNKLEDSDLEEGERGTDLRDRGPDGGPRRF